MGLIASGTGVGLAVPPKITECVASGYGWRGDLVFYGIFIVSLTIPIMLLTVRDTLECTNLASDRPDTQMKFSLPVYVIVSLLGFFDSSSEIR